METVREFVAKFRLAGKINTDEEYALLDFMEMSYRISPDGAITDDRRTQIRNMIGWLLNCGPEIMNNSIYVEEPNDIKVQSERADI